MGDVNTRIYDFYFKGREDAVDEFMDFLERLATRVDGIPIPQHMTASEFIRSMEKVVGQHYGRIPQSQQAS